MREGGGGGGGGKRFGGGGAGWGGGGGGGGGSKELGVGGEGQAQDTNDTSSCSVGSGRWWHGLWVDGVEGVAE